jgi:hypothetical protein
MLACVGLLPRLEALAVPVRLEVYVQPRASKTELAGMHGGVIKIRIAAPAVDNAANRALIDFVAAQLGVAKRSVRVVSGGASRRKLLEVDGVTAELVAATLGRMESFPQ